MNKILTTTGLTIVLVIGGLIGLLQTPVFASHNPGSGQTEVQMMDDRGRDGGGRDGMPVVMPKVTLDQAEATLLAKFPGATITKVTLQEQKDSPIWQFRLITADGKVMEVKIDATSGVLTKSEEQPAADVTKPAVGFDQAKAAVLAKFPDATIFRANLEDEDNSLTWKFRLIGTDSRVVDVTIDATTGQVLMTRELPKAAAPAISLDQAKAAALAQFPGATVNRAKLESEEGTMVWQLRLTTTDGKEVRVNVDAQTGKIVRSDVKSSGPGDGSGRRDGQHGRGRG